MNRYQLNGESGRSVAAFVEFIGWTIFALGIIFVFLAILFSNEILAPAKYYGESSIPFLLRIYIALPGVASACGGLIFVIISQIAKATFNTSEMTRDLLVIASAGQPDSPRDKFIDTSLVKKSSSSSNPVAKVSRAPVTDEIRNSITEVSGFKEGIIGNYLTVSIIKHKGMYRAYGREFKTLDEAKDFIETLHI